MTITTAHYELDGQQFEQRIDAMAHADIWGFDYRQITWVDPEAPWNWAAK